ncbi:right-handed parallel beta-helix repeat-containing protein [Luteimonas wenzhouensis]|uniref:Right-handed parallel beta-helix repeat-containing protein n=1 Tax=Luteimonas wenzhouensis TaxID=2599615 RepID=A0A5C5U7F6_9GAMM|nr:right-handed parallel beta-helix repeat-containing protein [Luteimonas wenzhouensis]TWT21826.1 right-handed parallel beta-helix repeat-containing protein [Luteimonas wenzhouensis]
MPRSTLTTALVLALASAPAWSAELFVSTSGNDSSADGSSARPYRTIGRAISASRAGDTVTVLNGTYNECVRLRHRLTLRSPSGQRAHIACSTSTANSVGIQVDPGASGSRIANLEISGGYYYGIMLQTDWYQGGPASATGASDVVMEDLLIRDTGRDGIKITPKSNRAIIRRVEIRNTGRRDDSNADGIDNVNGDGMVVEDSYIHNTATTGLYFKGGARNVVIQRNRIENTGDAGILAGFDTSPEYFDLRVNPDYYEAIDGIVRNNVVRNTRYAGIGLYASKNTVVANNTIVNAASGGHSAIYFGVTFQDWEPQAKRPANVNPKVVNNLIIQSNNRCVEIRYSNELGGLSGLSGSPGTDWNGYGNGCVFRDNRPATAFSQGNLSQWRNALNVDANSKQANYSVTADGHLPAGSPAIDAGTVLAEVTDDIDGQARRAPYDLGADEVGGGSPPPPTSPPSGRRSTGSQPLAPPSIAQAAAPRSAAAPARPVAATPAPAAAAAPAPARPAAALPATVRIAPPVLGLWSRLRDWYERQSRPREHRARH